jgi:hypothetical protein
MISYTVLQSRLSQRDRVINYRERLTSFAWRFHKWMVRNWPWVSKARYLRLANEQARLIHDLNMLAIECNRLERELRK